MGEAEANSLNKNAGLKLANNSNSFLRPNNAVSYTHLTLPTTPYV